MHFSALTDDSERRRALRGGHIDLTLLEGDSTGADLAGDGDSSWTIPAAGPDGPLSFLLPENQSLFRDSVNRIIQVPLQALRLGLTNETLPSEDAPELATEVRRFLDLGPDATTRSDAGQGLTLQPGFAQRILKRLGNAFQLSQRFFGGEAPTLAALDPSTKPLSLPLDGPTLQPEAFNPRRDNALTALRNRGSLRVGVASDAGGQARLSPDQERLLEQLAATLGSEAAPLALQLQPIGSPSEALAQLGSGAVDLLLPDAFTTSWLDGVVGVDSIDSAVADPAVLLINRASGIETIQDLGGSTLGLGGGSRVGAALAKLLSEAGIRASLQSFPDGDAALKAMQQGQLDGVVLRSSTVPEAQRQLERLGINSQTLPAVVLEAQAQVLVAADQSPLRDTLVAMTWVIGRAHSIGLRRSQVDAAYGQVLAGTAAEALQQLFDPDGDPRTEGALSAEQVRRLLRNALE